MNRLTLFGFLCLAILAVEVQADKEKAKEPPKKIALADIPSIVMESQDQELCAAAEKTFRKSKSKKKFKIFTEQLIRTNGDRFSRGLAFLGRYHHSDSAEALTYTLINRTTPIVLPPDDVLFRPTELKFTLRNLSREINKAYETGIRKQIFDQLKTWPEKKLMKGLKAALESTHDKNNQHFTRDTNEIIHLIGVLRIGSGAGLLVSYLNRAIDAPYRMAAMIAAFNIGLDSVPYLSQGLKKRGSENTKTKSFCWWALHMITDQNLKAYRSEWMKWYLSIENATPKNKRQQ